MEKEKKFYIYSFKDRNNDSIKNGNFEVGIFRKHIMKILEEKYGQDFSYCESCCNIQQNNVFILTKEFPGISLIPDGPMNRPGWFKYYSTITIPWKKRSKNNRHQIHNSHGPESIISHYAEGIIKELERLKLT